MATAVAFLLVSLHAVLLSVDGFRHSITMASSDASAVTTDHSITRSAKDATGTQRTDSSFRHSITKATSGSAVLAPHDFASVPANDTDPDSDDGYLTANEGNSDDDDIPPLATAIASPRPTTTTTTTSTEEVHRLWFFPSVDFTTTSAKTPFSIVIVAGLGVLFCLALLLCWVVCQGISGKQWSSEWITVGESGNSISSYLTTSGSTVGENLDRSLYQDSVIDISSLQPDVQDIMPANRTSGSWPDMSLHPATTGSTMAGSVAISQHHSSVGDVSGLQPDAADIDISRSQSSVIDISNLQAESVDSMPSNPNRVVVDLSLDRAV